MVVLINSVKFIKYTISTVLRGWYKEEFIQDNNTILANTKNQTKLLRSKDLGITEF